MKNAHEGTKPVKETKVDMSTIQNENITMNEGEAILKMFT